ALSPAISPPTRLTAGLRRVALSYYDNVYYIATQGATVSMTREARCRIGFDIGGTFTDFVLLEEDGGRLHTYKALTTSADPAAGSIAGLEALVAKAGKSFADIADIVHGTTIVTNAVIERRGARTALLTTRGFRDVLEMATE